MVVVCWLLCGGFEWWLLCGGCCVVVVVWWLLCDGCCMVDIV